MDINEFLRHMQENITLASQDFKMVSKALLAAVKEFKTFNEFYSQPSQERLITLRMNSEERLNDLKTMTNFEDDLKMAISIIILIFVGLNKDMADTASHMSDELFDKVEKVVIIFKSVEEKWKERMVEIQKIMEKFRSIAVMSGN